MCLHHIGIAVCDFATSIPFYVSIGYYKYVEVYDPEQNVYVCLLKHKENPVILELLMPYNEQSPINTIIKKWELLHIICVMLFRICNRQFLHYERKSL
ncbi:VOC family protein [uncultured Bacteroides sp.]|uniref:VOC family protein n=1 Tax=uncultured Bacteroides sp. TaxID=162156 RepID=UPI003452A5A3